MSTYDPHKIYEIGFIGAGNMAQAIGLALVKKGKVNSLYDTSIYHTKFFLNHFIMTTFHLNFFLRHV